MAERGDFIRWFSELSSKDNEIAGSKGASLAEMYNNKFPVPPGFVITAFAFKHFMEKSGLFPNILRMLDEANINDSFILEKTSKKIIEIIKGIPMPHELESEIIEAYEMLDVDKKNLEMAGPGALDILKNSHEPPFVAVRSSALTDSASGPRHHDSFLSVKGESSLIKHVKECFASLFTARAISRRTKESSSKFAIAVVIQKMVDAEKSGVIFSKNPLNKENIIIEAGWGLGEGIVSGKISPDNYIVNPDLKILKSNVADKKIAIARNSSGEVGTALLTDEKSKRQVLSDYEIKRLAQFALNLEEHFQKPQDVEFSIAGDEIFILQARPIIIKSIEEREVFGDVLISGIPASNGVVSGNVKIINDAEDLSRAKRGDIIVAKAITPDMIVEIQKFSGVIVDNGGMASFSSSLFREMQIPAIVGTHRATEKLTDGETITIDGFSGNVLIGKGLEKSDVKEIIPTKTKIKLVLDVPAYAERASLSGIKSIGLVKMETIVSESGKHPVWYVKNGKIKDYISSIHSELRKISLHFDDVWIKSLAIRSDRHKNLQGSPEDVEKNPLLGDHGIRFSLRNQEMFEAEIFSIKELADEFLSKKFGIMLSRIISVEELKEAKKIIKSIRCPENVKIGIMVETPAAAMIIDELCGEGISFVNIDINSLAQYVLAVDKDETAYPLYDEMHPAVNTLIKNVLRSCKKYSVDNSVLMESGNSEMIKFLLKENVGSMSVNAGDAGDFSKLLNELESSCLENDLDVKKEVNLTKHIEEIKDIGLKSQVYEEDLILKALEDSDNDYNPSLKEDEKENIPKLNEAIPIESDSLQNNQNEKVIEIEHGDSSIFEKQSEEILKEEINEVIAQSERDKEMMAELFGQNKKEDNENEKEGEKFQNIFDD